MAEPDGIVAVLKTLLAPCTRKKRLQRKMTNHYHWIGIQENIGMFSNDQLILISEITCVTVVLKTSVWKLMKSYPCIRAVIFKVCPTKVGHR